MTAPILHCKRFAWCVGMRSTDGCRVLEVDGKDVVAYSDKDHKVRTVKGHLLPTWLHLERFREDWSSKEPDLDDDATAGAFLGLVRREWGDPRASVFFSHAIAAYCFVAKGYGPVESYESFTDALIDALWLAPTRGSSEPRGANE